MQLLLISDNCCYEAVASNILKILLDVLLGYKRAGLYCTQAKTSCSWVNLSTFFMRHDNDNCDLPIQVVTNVKPAFVDVAHKLRERYSNISQIY